jgi:hypothetical protein
MTGDEALAVLGCPPPPSLQGCRSRQEAEDRLQAWKDGPVRTAYKARAKECHPDRGGDEDAMKRLNAAKALCDDLHVQARRPPQPQPVVVVVRTGWHSTGATTSATGAGWPWW